MGDDQSEDEDDDDKGSDFSSKIRKNEYSFNFRSRFLFR